MDKIYEQHFNQMIVTWRLVLLLSNPHGRSQPKIKGGANFLKLIYSAVFNDGKKLEG